MTIEFPDIIADYFAADSKKGAGAVAACFADDAVFRDEGHSYNGVEAIRQWKADASTKYTYTVEPFAISREGERTVVTSHLEGDFPGGTADLRYYFRLEGGKIADLEIVQ